MTQPFHASAPSTCFARAGLDARAWHIADSLEYRDHRRATALVPARVRRVAEGARDAPTLVQRRACYKQVVRRLAASAVLALAACGHLSDLVVAVDHGDLANARTLLDRGADPDAEDADGNSALMLAVWHGDADLVGRMLAKHADPNHANDFGATALHWAIDDAAKTKLLLDAGARADAEDRERHDAARARGRPRSEMPRW